MTEPSKAELARSVNHTDALPVGTRLAEFEILALLGVGGFGMVYKAFDHSLHRAVAIKEYMPSALAGRAQGQSLWVRSSSDEPSFQAGLASFVGEARLLAQFDHPSLVKVFRFWEANHTAYMVMPLYTGMTFKQARAQMRTPPPEIWLRKVLWSVLGALRVLHEGHTLHRDISPDNIFLQDMGPPVLLDLGAARHAINDQDRKHTAVLKVNYAPIEQYAEGDTDLRQGPWSDLYSLAAVVHGCLCNDTPLPSTLRSIKDRMVPFQRVAKTCKRQFGVEYSEPFVAAISQALSLQPDERPQSIDVFLQLMDMTSPPDGLDHFDFRADLGDIWVEPADQPGPGFVVPTVDVTSAPRQLADLQAGALAAAAPAASLASTPAAPEEAADTVMLDAGDTVVMEDMPDSTMAGGDTVFMDMDAAQGGAHATTRRVRAESDLESVAVGPRNGPRRHGHRRSSPAAWLAGLTVAAVVAGGGWWLSQARTKPPVKEDIITELREPASIAVAPVAEASLPEVAGGAVAEPAASTPASVPAVVAAVASQPGAGARTTRQRRAPAEAPVPVAVVQEAPPEPPPPPPEPKPRPAPAPRIPSPQEACADASFIARPMCIHQECQKPALANHPTCVENRRRYEADEQRRRQTPN